MYNIHVKTKSSTMYELDTLNKMKGKDLQEICMSYELKKSGKKAELVDRIIAHQEKVKKEEEDRKRILAHGEETRSEEFEKIIRAFQLWCEQEGFYPFYGYMTTKKVDINEIRSAFAEHDAELDAFFYMLFNIHDNWEFYDTTNEDREFDCDSEYNSNWLVRGMIEIYNKL